MLVLPLVPVMPNMPSFAAGCPCTDAAISAMSSRRCSDTMTGTPTAAANAAPSASVRIATAPDATARSAKRAPWVAAPGNAT